MKKTIITTNNITIETNVALKRVFIPLYSGGEKGRTMDYGVMCLRDSLCREGESPIMPDLAYIQCMNESDNAEMSRAGSASNEWLKGSEKLVVYIDRGISMAMSNVFMVCSKMRKDIEFRTLSQAQEKIDTVDLLNENILNIGVVIDIFDTINKKKKSNLMQSREHGDYCGEWGRLCTKTNHQDDKKSMVERVATREAILSFNEAPIPVHLMLAGNEDVAEVVEKKVVSAWGSDETPLITLTTGATQGERERSVNINEFGYDASLLREIKRECAGVMSL